MLKKISQMILTGCGWNIDIKIPQIEKYVLIGAPHTSNWDFPLTLLGLCAMGVRFNWVAKHSLFHWPLGVLFRSIGGVPVDRSSGTSFLKKAIELYIQHSRFILAIAPEGTRSKSKYWKTGFYTIALKAGVPVAMGYVDYTKKQIGIGEVFMPTGDIEKDFELIRDFYKDIKGRYPEKQGEISVKTTRKRSSKGSGGKDRNQ